MTIEQTALLKLVASALFEDSYSIPQSVDMKLLLKEADDQGVLGIVAAKGDAPEWKELKYSLLIANNAVFYSHTQLHNLLSSAGIPYVILKGCASAKYYPSPIYRTMGDVDFFVSENDFEKCSSLLQSAGFSSPVGNPEGVHLAFFKGSEELEMHRSINGIPEGKSGEIIHGYMSDIISSSIEYNDGNDPMRVPDDFHHGLVLLLHTASHLTSEGIGLRHLCDWAVFVNSFEGPAFAEIFEEKLSACGLWRFAQLLTLCSVKYLGLPYCEWAGEADETVLEQLILDILSGGNFGTKDDDRYRQIKYISNRGERTVNDNSAVAQVWNTIGKKAEIEGKTRFGVMVEYIGMVIKGERKADSNATIKKANARKKLYSEFKLFE